MVPAAENSTNKNDTNVEANRLIIVYPRVISRFCQKMSLGGGAGITLMCWLCNWNGEQQPQSLNSADLKIPTRVIFRN